MKNSTAVILILISVGLYYTFIGPEYQKIEEIRAKSDEYENILASVADLTSKRDDLLLKYQAMPQADIDKLSKVLPNNVDTVRLALDFDTIASKYGISIKNIKTSDTKEDNTATIIQATGPKPYQTVNVSFGFISNYDNFRKFLHDIEQSLRIIDISSLSFNAGENGLNDYKITVETYWVK